MEVLRELKNIICDSPLELATSTTGDIYVRYITTGFLTALIHPIKSVDAVYGTAFTQILLSVVPQFSVTTLFDI